jgi:ATP-dependent Clp protease ATP-binding subunit ClpX
MDRKVGQHCDFCNKPKNDVSKLVVGESAGICDECIKLCTDLMSAGKINEKINVDSVNPIEIKEYLDRHVIGQEHAKKILSVAVANHILRIKNPDQKLEKSNVLMIGPTGTGKTLLARSIAEFLDVPFAIADATSLTEAGYVGDDVENVITRLLQVAEGDIKKCEQGIIFIDEIDKISRKSEGTSITRDVSGEGVQQALLKLVEGHSVRVQPQFTRKHPDATALTVNTKNILFIVGGAFNHLEKIMNAGQGMGFGSTLKKNESNLKKVTDKDLMKVGMIPEFVGRFPCVTVLDALDHDQLIRVMREPENSVCNQFQKLFALYGVELLFEEDALHLIADRVIEDGTNARGIRKEIEKILLDTQFELKDMSDKGLTQVVVSKESVEQCKPTHVFKKQTKTKKVE